MDLKSKMLESVQKYIQKGHYDKAINEYKRVLKIEPGDVSTRLRVGDLYVKSGKKEDAKKEYNEVARNLTNGGFYLKAIAVQKQILKLDPENIDIRYKLAELYTKQGLVADAIGEYNFIATYFENKGKTEDSCNIIKKMLEIDPDNVGIRLKLAEIYQRSEFFMDAVSEYEMAIERLIKDGKFEKAERIFKGLYEVNKREPRIIEGLANIYRKKGDKEQLLRYLKELVNLYSELDDEIGIRMSCKSLLESFPDDTDTLSILEGLSIKKEEAPSVETGIETGSLEETEEEPLISWPEVEIGAEEVLEVDGNEQRAEEFVEKTEEVSREEPLASWSDMVEVEKEPELPEDEPHEGEEKTVEETKPIEPKELPEEKVSKETETAMDVAAPEVLEIKPPEALEEEIIKVPVEPVEEEPAEIHVEEEYIDLSAELGFESVVEFRNGIKKQLNKEDTETHFNLGIAYMEMEMFGEAIKEFKIAMKDPGLEFDCQVRLGLNFMAMGKPQEAISFYIKGLELKGRTDDKRKGLMYELALAYESAEQKDKAMEFFKKVYEMDSGFRDVSDKLLLYTERPSVIPVDDDLIEVEML
jgi:tetratricopeptide (TPR) repeat protein